MVANDAWPATHSTGDIALALVVLGNLAGNLLLKIGADKTNLRQLPFGLLPWHTAPRYCSSCLWHTDLFVGAVALLGEQISIQKWSGIALIALGLYP
jgi:hypothetical protein